MGADACLSIDMPVLSKVAGAMNVLSTAELDCSTVNFTKFGVTQKSQSVCRKDVKATTSNTPPSPGSSTPPALEPSASSGPQKTPTGAIAGGVVGGLLVALLMVIALGFLWRRKAKAKAKRSVYEQEKTGLYGRFEMEQRAGPVSGMAEAPEQDIQELGDGDSHRQGPRMLHEADGRAVEPVHEMDGQHGGERG